VFHYEFEFIHPFSDGNGRTGRLWQSLILGRLHPIFEHLPVENMVYSNQQAYYDAIGEATKQASSTPFIEFMLGEILKTLKEHQGTPIVRDMMQDKVRNKVRGIFGINSEKIIALLMDHPNYNLDDLAASMQVTRRAIEKHVKLLREAGFIKHVGSNKTGHWEIIDIKD
jgi:Fic family protein